MPLVVHGDFEWESAKAETNLSKHGVSFEEAATAITDPSAVLLDDPTDPAHLIVIGASPLPAGRVSSGADRLRQRGLRGHAVHVLRGLAQVVDRDVVVRHLTIASLSVSELGSYRASPVRRAAAHFDERGGARNVVIAD